MTSQVYYRKWRPASFGELVGQDHVATTLRQSLKQGRISHAYLFCGPRGSGKTTTARLVAKAVNCLALEDGDPCNACPVCLAVNTGRFMDIIELDAASNRGIDEIRDIREKVNFAPVQGRRKVYIIDEAHMLTDQASNAFLKTLEEPPGHVIFVLCTTEAHKILPTIISRCQRFDFRRIPSELIQRRLAEIIQAEGVAVEPEALRMVSRYAAGSLRDAENLLEQLVVSYGDGVGLRQVEELLGLGHGERWLELVNYLLMGNTSASLGVINQAAWDGTDLRQLHRQTLELLRSAMLLRWSSAKLLDLPDHVVGQLQQLVGQLPPWRIIRALKLWGEANLKHDAPSTLPLELAVVEICDDQAAPTSVAKEQKAPSVVSSNPPPRSQPARGRPAVQPAGAAAGGPSARPPVAPKAGTAVRQEASAPAAGSAPPVAEAPRQPAPAVATGDGGLAGPWLATVKTLTRQRGKKFFLGELLKDCRADAISIEGDTLVLTFTHRSHMERIQEEMDDPKGRLLVAEAVEQNFGKVYGIKLVLIEDNGAGGASSRPGQSSPMVRAAMGMGARNPREGVVE
jgi:DNA polymerase-3 subunit gamma/tau